MDTAKAAYDKLAAKLVTLKAVFDAAKKKVAIRIVEPKGQKAALTVETVVIT